MPYRISTARRHVYSLITHLQHEHEVLAYPCLLHLKRYANQLALILRLVVIRAAVYAIRNNRTV